jgi:hypothetical protein
MKGPKDVVSDLWSVVRSDQCVPCLGLAGELATDHGPLTTLLRRMGGQC